ncbi:MAG: phosphoribosylglycinamide formyltransferase [Phycisphaerales bacterium]|nr:phosphoribosylglycinamide formyltransferase [Phycisphaerales bacterium]
MNRARLVLMISGGGRTALNIADEIDNGNLDAEIAMVIASRECVGAERCRDRGLNVLVERGVLPSDWLGEVLQMAEADLVCLAGYLKLLPIPAGWEGRILNIHPALLPTFGGPGMYGDRVHQAVLEAGEQISGCTVHLCTDEFDRGPIVVQRTCPVLPDDTPETLAARVFEQECIAFPEAIRITLRNLARNADA